VRALHRGYRESIPWFAVKQFMHEIESCPLDSGYFHFWMHADLGYYTWSHLRNGRQIVGVGYEAADDLLGRHRKVVGYMRDVHNVRLHETDDREGSVNNFGLSLTNRYVFGRGSVLVTGQAAGFLNMIAEGMSCALHSGAIAGEAVVDAFRFGGDAQKVYRSMVASEVRRCSDQWNPLKIIFGRPHEADFMAALMRHSPADRRRIVGDIWEFLKPWARFRWGRQLLGQAVKRHFLDAYTPSRWL
jgi:flavin-dependent dehydrogenase